MDVKHIAKLASLPLTPDEETKFQDQLERTMDFINHLSKIDTKNITPTSQVTGKVNQFRDDKITPGLSQADALRNAKQVKNGYFVSKITWT